MHNRNREKETKRHKNTPQAPAMTTRQELTKGKRTATEDREIKCPHCERRCTIGTDGKTEYGHNYNCPRRPGQFPSFDYASKHWANVYYSDQQEGREK